MKSYFSFFILIYSPTMKSNNVKSQGIPIFLTFVHKERVNLLVNNEAQFAFSFGFRYLLPLLERNACQQLVYDNM